MIQKMTFTMKWVGVLIICLVNLPQAISQDEELLDEGQDPQWVDINVPLDYQNVQIPREFWQYVKEIFRNDGVPEKTIEDFNVLPVAIQVQLSSQDPKVLKDSLNYRVVYIEGGGTIDLFDYIAGKGPLNIRFRPEISDEGIYHLLYISDSPGDEVAGLKVGNGCGKIFDLTKNVELFVSPPGILLTSSRRLHLHVMAGTFVFMQLVDDRLFMSYIQVLDSRYPKFNCHET